VINAPAKPLRPITETAIYPGELWKFLNQQLAGKTLGEVAMVLDVSEHEVQRLLDGRWRPGKEICEKLGVMIVYAVSIPKGVQVP
jgi:plasmid maintenance system antidote protein VapI